MRTAVEITLNGVDMEVTGDYEPVIPARTFGPREDCHPESGGEFTPETVLVGGVDISELLADAYYPAIVDGKYALGSHIMSRIADLAYDAAVHQAQNKRDSDAEDRAEHWRMAA